MVGLMFLWFATSLMPRDRALNTIHEALTVSGGSFPQYWDNSRSYCASHSIQIFYGWPGEPVLGSG